jgi:hypothetical protein
VVGGPETSQREPPCRYFESDRRPADQHARSSLAFSGGGADGANDASLIDALDRQPTTRTRRYVNESFRAVPRRPSQSFIRAFRKEVVAPSRRLWVGANQHSLSPAVAPTAQRLNSFKAPSLTLLSERGAGRRNGHVLRLSLLLRRALTRRTENIKVISGRLVVVMGTLGIAATGCALEADTPPHGSGGTSGMQSTGGAGKGGAGTGGSTAATGGSGGSSGRVGTGGTSGSGSAGKSSGGGAGIAGMAAGGSGGPAAGGSGGTFGG